MTGACSLSPEGLSDHEKQKSDETQIELFGLKDKRHVWRKPGVPHHFLTGAAHGGGSIMLWRCFLAARTGRPIRVEGKRNAATYRDVITCSKELWIWRGVSCALTFALTIKNVLFLTSHRVTHRSWQNIYACVRTDSSVSWVSSGRHFDTSEAEYGPQMSSLFTVSITVESCFGHQGCESVTRLKTE